jgi:Tol biopolymer transport system component
MANPPTAVERIDGWKEIARYLGRDVTTAIRWERHKGLPVHRVQGGKRQPVFAYAHEIEHWLRRGSAGRYATDGLGQVAFVANAPASEVDSDVAVEDSLPDSGDLVRASTWRALHKALAGMGGLAIAITVLVWFLWPHNVQLTSENQITNDGVIKTHLVTDGKSLYFGEWRDARIVVAAVSVDGGPVREVRTPFVQTMPVGISKDGKRLLALVGEGQEQERALWVIPVRGGAPHRVGVFLCHAAAWSPGEHWIAYGSGNAIYLAGPGGQSPGKLRTFPAIPQELRWSLDGRRLIVRLRDSSTWDSSVWELTLGAADFRAGQVPETSLRPLVTTPRDYDSISPMLDARDDFFLGTEGEPSTIFTVRQPRLPWASRVTLERFAGESTQGNDFALDRVNRKLYMLKDTAARNELKWFNIKSHEFHPFLPSLSVRDVDFSRDGRSIAYVRTPDNSLWVAESDGESARQIGTPGMANIELPRWSSDGQQIAYMGRASEGPYRIYVTQAAGGAVFQASHGTDNQGAPTWSPDGYHLVYGRVFCQEEGTCAIQEINLRTGEQTTISGSEGLSTARWSPDGRFIAALRADKHEVWVLDRRSGSWRELAGGVNGNDLAWAPDSRAVYASSPDGERPELLRISVESGKTDPVVDLSDYSKLNGRMGTWFAVTPDDSFIFLRIVAGHEIYGLSYQ